MKSDDVEFNYKENKKNMQELSSAIEKRIKEDRIVSYVGLFALIMIMIFVVFFA